MGGSGNKSPMAKFKSKNAGVTIEFDDGTTLNYRINGKGVVTNWDGTEVINTNGLTLDGIVERAMKQGLKVTTYDKKQLTTLDAERKKDRETINKLLNYHDVRTRGAYYKAPRKGWKGH